jgi:hypothetical protein
MDATCSSETSFDFPRTTRRYIQEDRVLHNQCLIFSKEMLNFLTKVMNMFTRSPILYTFKLIYLLLYL